jgi:hypothetical protein
MAWARCNSFNIFPALYWRINRVWRYADYPKFASLICKWWETTRCVVEPVMVYNPSGPFAVIFNYRWVTSFARNPQLRICHWDTIHYTLFPLSNTYFRFKVCHERRSNMTIIVLYTRTTVVYAGQYEKTCKQHDLLTRRIGKRLAQPELFNWWNNNCCLFISSNLQLRNI